MAGSKYYEQKQKRDAEFINPPNILKQKVGHGGLSPHILKKAQTLLENNSVDFQPLGEMYLDALQDGIGFAERANLQDEDYELIIATLLMPAMQLKANGGMFNYHLISKMAEKLIHFLEVIEIPDRDAITIVKAFYTSMKAVVSADIRGDGGAYGKDLLDALVEACYRYFDKYPLKNTESRH